jgi:hypothetical protein
MSDKKSLLSIFSYCPDADRKKILHDLLIDLQSCRDKFDILVVSHSEIGIEDLSLLDYFYFDKNNDLLYDFDLTNKFWFFNDDFVINSSLVYPYSTHLAIYRLLYYSLNFCKFMGYDKIHFIEYDINLPNLDLISEVDGDLDHYDNVMFKSKNEDGWVYGTYFSSNVERKNLDSKFDRNKIINQLLNSYNRMTEDITPRILEENERCTLYKTLEELDPAGIFHKSDQHNERLGWCVPVCSEEGEDLFIFIFNEFGEYFSIEILIDSNPLNLETESKGVWNLINIGKISDINSIIIKINGITKKNIFLNSENIHKFKSNNFISWKIK